jgi:hypothetical protein
MLQSFSFVYFDFLCFTLYFIGTLLHVTLAAKLPATKLKLPLSKLHPITAKGIEADPSSLKPPAKEDIDPSSLKRPPTAGWEAVLKKQMNVFKPLSKGAKQKLSGSLYMMPNGVRVALPVPHHKQPPYIRYTTDVGVLDWVCTQCRSGCNNWLLCCDCFNPLHYDCS